MVLSNSPLGMYLARYRSLLELVLLAYVDHHDSIGSLLQCGLEICGVDLADLFLRLADEAPDRSTARQLLGARLSVVRSRTMPDTEREDKFSSTHL